MSTCHLFTLGWIPSVALETNPSNHIPFYTDGLSIFISKMWCSDLVALSLFLRTTLCVFFHLLPPLIQFLLPSKFHGSISYFFQQKIQKELKDNGGGKGLVGAMALWIIQTFRCYYYNLFFELVTHIII